jgi:hypothetical protein
MGKNGKQRKDVEGNRKTMNDRKENLILCDSSDLV